VQRCDPVVAAATEEINVELFRGAIHGGRWKLLKVATLPGTTELFEVVADPGETTDLAERHRDVDGGVPTEKPALPAPQRARFEVASG